MSPSLVNSLWGICVPKNAQSPLKYAYGSFFGCEKLRYLGKNVFKNLKDCKTIFHLFDGASIEYFYEYTLEGASNLIDLQYGFEACQMKGISPNLFKWCPNVTSVFHTFHRCDKLQEVPQGLFDPLPKLVNAEVCFKACTSLKTVPYNLFKKCYNIKKVYECFCGGRWNGDNGYNRYMSITSEIPPLWDKHYWDTDEYKEQFKQQIENGQWYPPQFNISPTSHTRYASGCINAQNYSIIQENYNDWI